MNIKSIVVVLLLAAGFAWAGCSKKEKCSEAVESAPENEVRVLEKFLSDNQIEATKDAHGFYYRIEAAGTGDHPGACAQVLVNYKGTLTTGAVFDQGSNVQFDLGGLIPGWKAGLPLVGKGGRIVLYLPPTLGYGSRETGNIPANSILIFSIDLIKVY